MDFSPMQLAMARTTSPHTRGMQQVSFSKHGINPFDALPLEMMHGVLVHLDNDRDICKLRETSKTICDAIDDNHFWHQRFHEAFERPRPGSVTTNGRSYKDLYQHRKKVLRKASLFENGNSLEEMVVLEVVKDLILDSYSELTAQNKLVYESKNIVHHITRLASSTNIVNDIFNKQRFSYHKEEKRTNDLESNKLLRAIQIMLAPYTLRQGQPDAVAWSFPDSQYDVYAATPDRPIFLGCDKVNVNMDWVLHQINFWKYHMNREEECSLFIPYESLPASEAVPWWDGPIGPSAVTAGTSVIGKNWKGAYGFLQHGDLARVRASPDHTAHVIDEFNNEESGGEFQNLRLTLTQDGYATWPPHFEYVLRSLAPPTSRARTRAQRSSAAYDPAAKPHSFRFGGVGEDVEERFHADGWLNPLPEQLGIPGWQRMTMMKYFLEQDGQLDSEALWAYEGVVLPGGKIIVGRWWSPASLAHGAHNMYSGPFIMWCVDGKNDDGDGEGERDGVGEDAD